MTILLHDLAGADPSRRFSPYCWRAKLALAHKGLAVETRPWRFVEKDAIADAGSDKVPVIRDGDRVVAESWAIAEYLEDAYPGRPSLFRGEGGRALAKFVNAWADAVMIPGIVRLIIGDIPRWLTEADRAYFIASREKRFGAPLEQVQAGRDEQVAVFRESLHPLRMIVRERPYLCGATPAQADYIAFGGLQWARCVSGFPLLTAEDPLHAWRGRILDAFGGLARGVPAEDAA